MKFVFDYEETRVARLEIEASDLGEAIDKVFKGIDEGKYKCRQKDFVGGTLKMPLDQNFLPYVERFGERVEESKECDIVLHYW